MHRIDIPQNIRDRALRARGREYSIEAIDPARTAHIVVDLQNGFMAEGAPLEVPVARAIVPNVGAGGARDRAECQPHWRRLARRRRPQRVSPLYP